MTFTAEALIYWLAVDSDPFRPKCGNRCADVVAHERNLTADIRFTGRAFHGMHAKAPTEAAQKK